MRNTKHSQENLTKAGVGFHINPEKTALQYPVECLREIEPSLILSYDPQGGKRPENLKGVPTDRNVSDRF